MVDFTASNAGDGGLVLVGCIKFVLTPSYRVEVILFQ